MKQIPSYGDGRTLRFCAFCGGETGTRDRCPSRAFLDEPFPTNLPVVPACPTCNTGFSADEEYLACPISCTLTGPTEPNRVDRDKIAGILVAKPTLRARPEACQSASDGHTVFEPERDRVSTVVTKLAQGHALYIVIPKVLRSAAPPSVRAVLGLGCVASKTSADAATGTRP